MFDKILGDKNLFKSMTAWGVFVYSMGPGIINAAVDAGFFTPQGGDTLLEWVAKIGGILAALGIRKAIGKAAA